MSVQTTTPVQSKAAGPTAPTNRTIRSAAERPTARRLSLRLRRLGAAVIAGAALSTVAGVGMANAGYGGAGDCVHYSTSTVVSVPLPANQNLTGWTTQAWLYRWNGSAWAYAGATTWARGAAGYWTNPNGNMIQDLAFKAGRSTGSYLIFYRVTAPNGAYSQAWMQRYEYDFNESSFGSSCRA